MSTTSSEPSAELLRVIEDLSLNQALWRNAQRQCELLEARYRELMHSQVLPPLTEEV